LAFFIYDFQEKNAFPNNFQVGSGIRPDSRRVKNLMTRLEYHGSGQVNYPTRPDPCGVLISNVKNLINEIKLILYTLNFESNIILLICFPLFVSDCMR
jgi:hypothetical protein